LALCGWGYVVKFFLEKFYIMGYKNARNGKGASKIPKWLSLRPLELKSTKAQPAGRGGWGACEPLLKASFKQATW